MEYALCAQNFSILMRQQIKALASHVEKDAFPLSRIVIKLLIYSYCRESSIALILSFIITMHLITITGLEYLGGLTFL